MLDFSPREPHQKHRNLSVFFQCFSSGGDFKICFLGILTPFVTGRWGTSIVFFCLFKVIFYGLYHGKLLYHQLTTNWENFLFFFPSTLSKSRDFCPKMCLDLSVFFGAGDPYGKIDGRISGNARFLKHSILRPDVLSLGIQSPSETGNGT